MKRTLYLKIYEALLATSHPYVTADMLASTIGIYPDVINEALSLFNPVVTLDVTFNLKELIPQLEGFLQSDKPRTTKRNRSQKMQDKAYASIADFVYEKMTIAGIVDKDIRLTDQELRLAKRLITAELKSRKK
jgi:hypothetical protein